MDVIIVEIIRYSGRAKKKSSDHKYHQEGCDHIICPGILLTTHAPNNKNRIEQPTPVAADAVGIMIGSERVGSHKNAITTIACVFPQARATNKHVLVSLLIRVRDRKRRFFTVFFFIIWYTYNMTVEYQYARALFGLVPHLTLWKNVLLDARGPRATVSRGISLPSRTAAAFRRGLYAWSWPRAWLVNFNFFFANNNNILGNTANKTDCIRFCNQKTKKNKNIFMIYFHPGGFFNIYVHTYVLYTCIYFFSVFSNDYIGRRFTIHYIILCMLHECIFFHLDIFYVLIFCYSFT